MKVGDKLICKKSIKVGFKNDGIFFYRKYYEIATIARECIEVYAENGGCYLFFSDYRSVVPDRYIFNCFFTDKEIRKLKLERIESR